MDTASRTMQMLQFLVGTVSSFLSNHFDYIIAAFILWLAYRLLRTGLEKVSTGEEVNWYRFAAFLAPGAGFALLAIIFVMGLDPLSLIIYLLTFAVLVGFGFAALGYRLFDKGISGVSDFEAAWNNKKVLLKQAAPGTLFAFFGFGMIGASIWMSPRVLRDYFEHDRLYKERVITVVDERAKDALAILREYLGQKEQNSGAQNK